MQVSDVLRRERRSKATEKVRVRVRMRWAQSIRINKNQATALPTEEDIYDWYE